RGAGGEDVVDQHDAAVPDHGAGPEAEGVLDVAGAREAAEMALARGAAATHQEGGRPLGAAGGADGVGEEGGLVVTDENGGIPGDLRAWTGGWTGLIIQHKGFSHGYRSTRRVVPRPYLRSRQHGRRHPLVCHPCRGTEV